MPPPAASSAWQLSYPANRFTPDRIEVPRVRAPLAFRMMVCPTVANDDRNVIGMAETMSGVVVLRDAVKADAVVIPRIRAAAWINATSSPTPAPPRTTPTSGSSAARTSWPARTPATGPV